MQTIRKKLVVDEQGRPQEVIIAWQDYRKIEEALGLDLDDGVVRQLRQARSDRETGREDAYVDLDAI
ncbi:MAG: hypothetical protein GY835_11505 [bacterium]|nr:hypothetical protein [bacterium]